MKLVSGIVDSGFFAQSALSAEVATKDSLGRNISETYLTTVDIPESANWNSTYNTVHDNSGSWTGGGTANPQIPVTSTSGISIFESGDKVYFNISADYAFNSDLQSVSAEITGMIPAPFDPTYLSGQIDTKLDSAIYANDSGSFLTALPSDLVYTADIQDMATTGQVAEKLDTTAFSTVSGDFLTAHQDLSDYQTTAGMTAYQEITGMTAYQPVGSYLSANALNNLSGNWETVTAKLDTTAFSDVSGTFLTAHQDISNKLDTTAFSDVSGNFLTAVPDTYLQNTDLTIVDNKITEISGVPLSAGDELPSGVMNTSALEYNAVNEISGYNGSAIAQYGAEKQWLVHDDTIVHQSNSAQYAFGVNLSAVEQLLGIDETLLWSGSKGSVNDTMTLSEPCSAFNRVRFVIDDGNAAIPYHEFTSRTNGTNLYPYFIRTNSNLAELCGLWTLNRSNDDKTLTVAVAVQRTNGTTSGSNNSKFIEIIGIGRKEV